MSSITTTFRGIDEISGPLSKINESIGTTIRQMEKLNQTMGKINANGFNGVTSATTGATNEMGKLENQTEKATSKINNIQSVTKSLHAVGSGVSFIGKGMMALGAVGLPITTMLGGIAAKSVKTAVGFDQLYQSSQIIFERMLGSGEKAKELYTDLYEIARRSPFPIETFLQASKSLVGVGISADKTTKYMQAMTDAVAGFGGGAEQFDQLAFAFRRVATNGRVSMMEVNMMADDGINALQILGNHYGKTTEEMRDMIANEFVSADEALDIITEGIEKGTNGINGATQALGGMAQALKGKTITGAFDSMHTSIREFALGVLQMDDRTEEGKIRVNQLTASIMAINDVIKNSVPLFKGITDAVGGFLNKLIGSNPVFNEQTGQWEQTDGILTRLNNTLKTMDDEKLAKIGSKIVKLGVGAPVLMGVGRALDIVGQNITRLSQQKEALEKIYNIFTKKPETPSVSADVNMPKPQNVSTGTVSAPDVDTPFQNVLNKIKSYGERFKQSGSKTADDLTGTLNTKTSTGLGKFAEKIKEGFSKGKQEADTHGSILTSTVSKWKNTFLQSISKGKWGESPTLPSMDLSVDVSKNFGLEKSKGNFISKYFARLNQDVNKEGLTFGQNFKKAITDNLPSGQGLGNKTKSVFTNFSKSSKELGSTGLSMVKALIPDNITELVQKKLGKVGESCQKMGKQAADFFSKGFAFLSEKLGVVIGYVTQAFQGLVQIFAPLGSALSGVIGPIAGFATAFLGVVAAITVVMASLGLVIGLLGKFGQQIDAVTKINDFFTNFQNNVANFGTTVMNALNGFFDDIKQNFPTYATYGGQMIASFITGVLTSIPRIIQTGAEILITFVTGLITSLPSLITAGFNAIISFIQGITSGLPAIGSSVNNMATGIVTTLQNNWPQIQAAGGQIIQAIGAGITALLPVLWECAVNTFNWLKDGFVANFPQIMAAGGQLIGNIITGLVSGIPWLLGEAANLVGQLVGFLWGNRWNILNGAVQMFGGILDAILQVGGAIISGVAELGGNIIQGLLNGLQGMWNSVCTWATDSFNWLVDQVKGIFGIASPSTVMMDIGGNIMEGLKQGLEGMRDAVLGVAQGIGQAILDFFNPHKEEEVDYSDMITKTSSQIDELKAKIQTSYAEIVQMTAALNQQVSSLTVSGFGFMTSQVLSSLSVLATQSSVILSGIPTRFSETFTQIYATVMAYMTTLKDQTILQVADMITGTQGPIGQLATIFNGVFTQISLSTTTLFTNLLGVATTNIGLLISAVSIQLGLLGTTFTIAFTSFVTTATTALLGLEIQTTDIISRINTSTTETFNNMSLAIQGCFSGINESVTMKLNELSASISTIIGAMNMSLLTSTDVFRIEYEAKWGGMTATIEAILREFVAVSTSILGLLRTNAIVSLGGLESTAIQIFNQIRDEGARIMGELRQKVETEVNKLPSTFRSAGESMMSQLRDGIVSSQQQVINATSDLVNKLKNTFLNGLGIHSPSRFMEWVGKMMAAGLVNGLSRDEMRKFAEAVIGDMKSSFKQGKFDPNQLVDYLGTDTEKVIEYLIRTGDETVSEAAGAQAGKPPIIQAAEKHLGYKQTAGGTIFGAKYGNPGGAWCAYFVRAMAEEVGVPFPPTGYVPDVMSWAQRNGRWTQTPVPGYAAIFGGGSHIELVADVNGSDVTCIGGNTGSPRGVYERVRNGATGYVALDGGRPIAQTLKDVIQQAYIEKMLQLIGSGASVNIDAISKFIPGYKGAMNLDVTGSGLHNPAWFQRWTPPPMVARWAPQVLTILTMLHEPLSLLKGVLFAINGESGGNPNDTYLGDINVIYGGSKGLLQTITPNFEKWKNPSLKNDPYDPLQNIWVCLREMQDTYGGIAELINHKIDVGHWFGYAVGTRHVPEDMLAMIHEGEAILPKKQNPYSQSGGNYLKEIGDQIGVEVVKSAFNVDLLPEYYPEYYQGINDDGLNYSALSDMMAADVTNVSNTSSTSAPINVSVNISNINNKGDLDNAENQIVTMLTNAINRANIASGSVASV